MLRRLFTFASLMAIAAALPASEKGIIASMEPRDYATPTEVSGTCYIPSGNAAGCPSSATKTTGDTDDGKKTGITVHNKDSQARSFFIYKNNCDCLPVKYISVPANGKKFIAMAAGFQGRMMRGTEAANLDGKSHALGTWMEFSWDADGKGWADVSLIKGCDGAVDVTAADGVGAQTGFNDDVLDGAPAGAYRLKAVSGSKVIMETESLTDASVINTTPRDWLYKEIGVWTKAYIDDHHGNPDICSANGRFDINFYPGRP
ncbi:hypothetical protein AB5N19_01908 [Seiridium cardinale]